MGKYRLYFKGSSEAGAYAGRWLKEMESDSFEDVLSEAVLLNGASGVEELHIRTDVEGLPVKILVFQDT